MFTEAFECTIVARLLANIMEKSNYHKGTQAPKGTKFILILKETNKNIVYARNQNSPICREVESLYLIDVGKQQVVNVGDRQDRLEQ